MLSLSLTSLGNTIALIGSTNYILQAVGGIEDAGRRVSSYELPGQDGGSVSSVFYGVRTVDLSGVVLGSDATTHQANRKALAAVCAVQRDLTGRPLPVTVAFTTLDGQSFSFTGHVKAFSNPLDRTNVSEFHIVLACPDPVIYGSSAITTGQFARPSGGGVVYPVTYPAIYAGSTGGSGSVSNTGNANVYPLITIRGVTTNPYIYFATLGVWFQLNYVTSNITDTIVIDMKNRTVVLNGTTNLLSAKVAGSSWFSLAPGANNFTFSTGTSSDTGTVEVSAAGAGYVGV